MKKIEGGGGPRGPRGDQGIFGKRTNFYGIFYAPFPKEQMSGLSILLIGSRELDWSADPVLIL